MAVDKKLKKKKVSPTSITRRSNKNIPISEYFHAGESYTSLLLGIIVVITASILLLSLFKTRTSKNNIILNQGTTSISTSIKKSIEPTDKLISKPTNIISAPQHSSDFISKDRSDNYTVRVGDNLWNIAERKYNDGHKWVLIAKANHLSNPRVISPGYKLIIPSNSPSMVEKNNFEQFSEKNNTLKISGKLYTVVKDDNLWNISIRAYGTGYRWVDIVKANNIINPSIIHAGNRFIIPR